MARKKIHIEEEKHDRWLISYADFITLLFAFFVVMYSVSSVNEGKYRVLSDSVSSAFRPSTRSMEPIQVGQLARGNNTSSLLPISQPFTIMPLVIPKNDFIVDPDALLAEDVDDPALLEASKQMEEIAENIGESLEDFIDEDEVTLRSTPLWLEIEINSNLLFTSASATPSLEADEILSGIAELISGYPNRVQVEGFTDNEPIQNSVYPSNWELSSARAAAVVRLFEQFGVDPTRMASIGYGEFKPVTDNNSIESRAANRRVVVVIMADTDADDNIELMRQRIGN